MPEPKPNKAPAEPASFEEAVKRLEEIVARMEAGAEDLDAMVKDFEEGRALVDFCGRKLTAIERTVEILTRRADGSAEAKPFAEEP